MEGAVSGFDTGLEMELLQEYCLVALDVYRQFPYPKVRSEQTAWLSLLTAENLSEAEELIQEYPWLEEIYEEMAGLMHNPKEVLDMFSDALRILDHNTVQYMIEEQKKEIEKQKEEIAEYEKRAAEIKREQLQAEKEKEAAEKEKEAAEKEKEAAEKEKEAAEKEKEAAEKEKDIAERLKVEAEKQKQQAEILLQEKETQIAELLALLNNK